MKNGQVGIGIIGTGFGAAVQLPAFLQIPSARVVGIASTSGARELAAAQGLQNFDSWKELVADPQIDLVSIVTPPFAHAELARACLAAGKAVLCEKPFTLSAAEAKTLLNDATTKKLLHAVDFEFRYLPAFQYVHKRLREKGLGTVEDVTVTWEAGGWRDAKRPWSWQMDRSSGGGVLGALGVHVFDYLEWLFSPVRSVTCEAGVHIRSRKDAEGKERPVTAEDYAKMQLQLEGGLPVSFTLTNVAEKATGHWVVLRGDKGSMKFGSDYARDYAKGFRIFEQAPESSAWKETYADPDPETIAEDGRIAPFRLLAEMMVRALRDGSPYRGPTFQEGLRTQMIREAALTAAQTHKQVDVA